MIKYAIVPLEENATSFCYYRNNFDVPISNSELIPLELLQNIILFSQKNNLTINYLYGNTSLPKEYEKIIKENEHTKIQPISKSKLNRNAIVVINPSEVEFIGGLTKESDRNIILRIEMEQLKNLSQFVISLLSKCKRINVMLLDIDKYSAKEYDLYQNELSSISNHLSILYKSRKSIELNLLTDRMLLSEMNNCNAGLDHITIALNGKFYLCPGFYNSDTDESIGNLEDGLLIKNNHLLRLDKSPICRNCDAYQCKRCIYLNKLTTLEINTPSHQQCIVSHIERGKSKEVLDLLSQTLTEFQSLPKIDEISYMDPFELVRYSSSLIKQGSIESKLNIIDQPNYIDSVVNLSDRELLESIFRMQNEIINRLTK